MEKMVNHMPDYSFWRNKSVFVTGHTGFKGSWLCLWLTSLGAKVTGYGLRPPTNPSMFELCRIDQWVTSIFADIRDRGRLCEALWNADPDIVFHLAAQPLVRTSYQSPAETYEINMMGTVNLLEAIRSSVDLGKRRKAVVNVTTDKCYENKEWLWSYRENEPLGGYDPYSASKACSELITSSYRRSYFHANDYPKHEVGLASARAGNVIGGGDWSADRLIPDCIRCLLEGAEIQIRNPQATRPWQHVMEPLSGYLLLARKLYENGPAFAEEWNFGPNDADVKPVEWVVKEICRKWGGNTAYRTIKGNHPHEAGLLKLDCSKAKSHLGWHPRWSLEQTIDKLIEWTRVYSDKLDLRAVTMKQIEEFGSKR